jgi:hypothetical protein
MQGKRILLWSGTIFSVALCLFALVYGGLSFFFFSEIATPEQLSVALAWWIVSLIGTFILSVFFLIVMLRKGEIGR